MKIILYIAISADGFVADENGGVAWLDEYAATGEDYGYHKFYDTIDAIVYGKTTYEQVLTFSPWPYPDKQSYVFVDQEVPSRVHDNVEFVQGDILDFMRKIESKGIKRLYLMGGAKLAESFYNLRLIDEYQITIVPKKIDRGIALLPAIIDGINMQLVDKIVWPSGVVQKIYIKIK